MAGSVGRLQSFGFCGFTLGPRLSFLPLNSSLIGSISSHRGPVASVETCLSPRSLCRTPGLLLPPPPGRREGSHGLPTAAPPEPTWCLRQQAHPSNVTAAAQPPAQALGSSLSLLIFSIASPGTSPLIDSYLPTPLTSVLLPPSLPAAQSGDSQLGASLPLSGYSSRGVTPGEKGCY